MIAAPAGVRAWITAVVAAVATGLVVLVSASAWRVDLANLAPGALLLWLVLWLYAFGSARAIQLAQLWRSATAEAVDPRNVALFQELATALRATLSALRPADADGLSLRARSDLVSVLNYTSDSRTAFYSPRVAISVLGALEVVGRGDALPIVRRLAVSTPNDVRQEPVIAAARKCLSVLADRVVQTRSGLLLLRSSRKPTAQDQPARPLKYGRVKESDSPVQPVQTAVVPPAEEP
jgi:hypothetical protein